MRLEPKLRREIEEQLDYCVELAQNCVEKTGIAGSEVNMEEAGLRNLQNMASATDSVKALENFVLYQMGRRKEWRHNNFGWQVLKDLEQLADKAKEIAGRSPDQVKAVHLELIRFYLGFLVRSFVAKRPREGGEYER